MSVFIMLCFVVLVGLGVVAYLLASEKKEVKQPLPPEESAVIEVESAPRQESWTIKSIKKEFDAVKHSIKPFANKENRPGKQEAVRGFFSYVGYVFRLTIHEKEIITFSILQLLAIAVGYFLWVQMLHWIPAEVWRSAAESDDGSIADLVLILWSFVCVGVAAFPLSIFSGCIGAVHFLRRQGKSSTIAACLKIVLTKAWPLWVFQWIDGWITVNQILDRLPKKNDRRTFAEKALSEALYYAWKLGTIGILPSLVTGRGLVESCKQSIEIVRHKTKEVVALRVGYSVLCWIVGVCAYIGTIFFFATFHNLVPAGEEIYGHVYTFYFWAAVPILIAVAVVQLFLRPIYLIASCEILSEYLEEKQQKIILPRAPSKSISALVAFLVLVLALVVVFLYRHQLGIMDMLATPYGQEYVPK